MCTFPLSQSTVRLRTVGWDWWLRLILIPYCKNHFPVSVVLELCKISGPPFIFTLGSSNQGTYL